MGAPVAEKADHEALLAAAVAPNGAPDAAATEQQPAAPLAPDRASSDASAIPLALDLTGAALASDPQLMRFLQDAEDRFRLPPPRALALYRINPLSSRSDTWRLDARVFRSTVAKPYRRHNLMPEATPARFPPP
jgi:hypothetical protein